MLIWYAWVCWLTIVSISTSSSKRFYETPFFPTKEISNVRACTIEAIENIPAGAIVIAGHAYGKPGTTSNFIDQALLDFLDTHKKNISFAIFSGDVFRLPSKKSWGKLHNRYHDHFQILIAPGNHDVGERGEATLRKVFRRSAFYPANGYPFAIDIDSGGHRTRFIIEDSIETGWQLHPNLLKLKKNGQDATIIVRHNISFTEQEVYANSLAGKIGDLPSIAEKDFGPKTQIISGDGGAFDHQPRYSCIQNNSGLRGIVSGIGGIDGDSVLVMHKGKLRLKEIR